jgi:hypothetical protein
MLTTRFTKSKNFFIKNIFFCYLIFWRRTVNKGYRKFKENPMYRLTCIGTVLLCLSLWGMEEVTEHVSGAATAVSTIARDNSELYVPENVDVTCCLEESTKLCYVMHGLCKVGMGVCEIASLILSGISVTEIKDNPGAAWGLGVASAVANGASLGLTYGAFKMEDKIRKLDRAVAKARGRRPQTEV